MNPEDSISNVASKHSSKKGSQSGRSSTTSSTTVKAEAEQAALLAQATTLQKMHVWRNKNNSLKGKWRNKKNGLRGKRSSLSWKPS